MYYVSMIDKVLSDFKNSPTEGKKNRLIFECENLDEANIVAENAKKHGDMKGVKISQENKKPTWEKSTNYVQIKTKENYSKFYRKGAFK